MKHNLENLTKSDLIGRINSPHFSKSDKEAACKELNSRPTSNIYSDHGYSSRQDYLLAMSEEYNVDINIVDGLADVLGPTEDFDGLVSALEDAANISHINS